MPDYTAPGAIARLQGESFADFSARQKAHRAAALKPKPKRRVKKAAETFETRADDIGLSPDL